MNFFNIAVKDVDEKKSACYSRVVATELIVSRSQCNKSLSNALDVVNSVKIFTICF